MPDAAPATAPAADAGAAARAARRRRLATPELVLLALLVGELVWFSIADV